MPLDIKDPVSLLLNTRQLRDFTDQPASQADIDQILEVARWTGSAKNQQHWSFVLIDDRELLRELSAFQWHEWVDKGSFLFAVLTRPEDGDFGPFDAGRVLERVMLAATALGLGAGIVTWQERDFATVRSLLNVPEQRALFGAVAVGSISPASAPLNLGGRKPLSEILVHNRFPD